MTTMAKYKRYDIWQANVKFEDTDETKERPVLIWNDLAFVIGYKMTGTDRGDSNDEYRIRYWKEAGLTKPTSIRLNKVVRLKSEKLLYKIGTLDIREQVILDIRLAM